MIENILKQVLTAYKEGRIPPVPSHKCVWKNKHPPFRANEMSMYVVSIDQNWNESSYSSQRPIQDGVPQDSLLGPTLSTLILMKFRQLKKILKERVISIYGDDTNNCVRSGSIDTADVQLTQRAF
jgi:hypothetical protein